MPYETLRRLYGVPHEALHVLALLLIGRRPERVTRTHVDIPPDLTTRQYVFVAGMPALVFGVGAALGVLGLLRAETPGQTALGLLVALVLGVGAAGTVGDVNQIALRLLEDREARIAETQKDEETHGG